MSRRRLNASHLGMDMCLCTPTDSRMHGKMSDNVNYHKAVANQEADATFSKMKGQLLSH